MIAYTLGYLTTRLILAADRLLRPDIAARNAWLATRPGLDDQAEYRAAWADVSEWMGARPHPCMSRHLSDENLARLVEEWSR